MSSASSGFGLLERKTPTPIANLSPNLPDQNLRAVTGEVTLVWPYNTATTSLAFLLADPDVRRRRDKGQVRVQLQAASAKAVADIRLGGGDTVAIDLDGADWVKDNSVVRVPGSRVEWQLQYTDKLRLQVCYHQLDVRSYASLTVLLGADRRSASVEGSHCQPNRPRCASSGCAACSTSGGRSSDDSRSCHRRAKYSR